MFRGEIISFIVALSWTATALLSEVASKKMGTLAFNVLRMSMSLTMLAIALWYFTGAPYPIHTDADTWLWLGLSGFVGYVLGDYCLFQSYILIGSRFGQLFMTLSAPSAALIGWILLGEQMRGLALLGMCITCLGIAISVMNKGGEESTRKFNLKLPIKGVLFAIGAGVGQGTGLVLSKLGMHHYTLSMLSEGVIPDDMMPFASTMIRAIIGMTGFTISMLFFSRTAKHRFIEGVKTPAAVFSAFGASFFGPFVGVSLSLMATLYTTTGIAQTIMSLTPVFILLPSYLLFHQKVTIAEIFGAMISCFGVALFFV